MSVPTNEPSWMVLREDGSCESISGAQAEVTAALDSEFVLLYKTIQDLAAQVSETQRAVIKIASGVARIAEQQAEDVPS